MSTTPITTTVPILMYHAVAADPAPATRRLSVRPDILAAQLGLLRQQGFTTLTFSSLGAVLRGDETLPPRPIVLTFDDGYADFHREALPLLARHGATATLFVTTGWVADAGEHAAGTPLDRMLSWSQIEEVSAAGFEVGAHSHSHAQLDQLSDAALQQELSTSKMLLEDRLRRKVPGLAYPYGYSSARVRRAARVAGYRQAAAVANTGARLGYDVFALPRFTIRHSTDLDTFHRIVHGHGTGMIFLADRVRTAGWAAVRHTRYAAAKVGRRG